MSHIQGLSSPSVAEAFANNTLTDKQKLMKAQLKLRELAIRNKEQGLEIQNKELAIRKKNKDLVNKVKNKIEEAEESIEVKMTKASIKLREAAIRNKDKVRRNLEVKTELDEEVYVDIDDEMPAWTYCKVANREDDVHTPEPSDSDDEQGVHGKAKSDASDSDADDRWGTWQGKISPQAAQVIDSDDEQCGIGTQCGNRWGTWDSKKIGMKSFDRDARAEAEAIADRESMEKRAQDRAWLLSPDGLKALAKKRAKDKARALDEARSSSKQLVEVKQEQSKIGQYSPVIGKGKAIPFEQWQEQDKREMQALETKGKALVSDAKAQAKQVPTPPDRNCCNRSANRKPPTEEQVARAKARAKHEAQKVAFWTLQKIAEDKLRIAFAKLHTGTPVEHLTETIRLQYMSDIDDAKARYAQIWTKMAQYSVVMQGADPFCESDATRMLMASLHVAAAARVDEWNGRSLLRIRRG